VPAQCQRWGTPRARGSAPSSVDRYASVDILGRQGWPRLLPTTASSNFAFWSTRVPGFLPWSGPHSVLDGFEHRLAVRTRSPARPVAPPERARSIIVT
jgi:hypothetical protein